MKSREQLEIAVPGSPSRMPCAPQGVKAFDDDDHICNSGSELCPTL